MRMNLPVTQKEYDWDQRLMIVSSTDTRGYITHCNQTFVEVSGYTFEESWGLITTSCATRICPPSGSRTCGEPLGVE